MSVNPSAQTRQGLLDAALAVLQDQGPAALTVRAIAEEAGCSTTGIYTHFGGKNGLVEAIFVEGFASFDRFLAAAYAADDLELVGDLYRRWALDNPTRYLVMFGRAVPDFEASEQAMDRAASSFAHLVDAVARAGADDPVVAAFHLYATVHGYVMLELVDMAPPGLAAQDELYRNGVRAVLARLGSG